jgi:hypothetical protein
MQSRSAGAMARMARIAVPLLALACVLVLLHLAK